MAMPVDGVLTGQITPRDIFIEAFFIHLFFTCKSHNTCDGIITDFTLKPV